MRAVSLEKSPHAIISRALAGIRAGTLIINLPGSPRAAVENLAAVWPAVGHAWWPSFKATQMIVPPREITGGPVSGDYVWRIGAGFQSGDRLNFRVLQVSRVSRRILGCRGLVK